MIAAYIIAGGFIGFHFYGILSMMTKAKATIPLGASLMMAFVGCVAGHFLFNLIY